MISKVNLKEKVDAKTQIAVEKIIKPIFDSAYENEWDMAKVIVECKRALTRAASEGVIDNDTIKSGHDVLDAMGRGVIESTGAELTDVIPRGIEKTTKEEYERLVKAFGEDGEGGDDGDDEEADRVRLGDLRFDKSTGLTTYVLGLFDAKTRSTTLGYAVVENGFDVETVEGDDKDKAIDYITQKSNPIDVLDIMALLLANIDLLEDDKYFKDATPEFGLLITKLIHIAGGLRKSDPRTKAFGAVCAAEKERITFLADQALTKFGEIALRVAEESLANENSTVD